MDDVARILKELREAEAWLHGECDFRSDVVREAIALIEPRLEPEWISVEDRLPEFPADARDYAMHIDVLTADTSGRVRELRYARQMHAMTERGRLPRWEEPGGGRLAYSKPTHWRPMPTFMKPEKESTS